jgi:hypothetical protein
VLPQPGRLLVADGERAHLLHHQERTLEELVVGHADDQVIRLARRTATHMGLGQLGQTDREVDVGIGIVGRPVPAVHDPAVVEGAVEIGRRRNPCR